MISDTWRLMTRKKQKRECIAVELKSIYSTDRLCCIDCKQGKSLTALSRLLAEHFSAVFADALLERLHVGGAVENLWGMD